MGGKLTLNDTLRVAKGQGFPLELDIPKHLIQPYKTEDFLGKIFAFEKPELRFYQPTPIRCCLVEDIEGKWLYWGMCHILNITLDYEKNTTRGEYRIVYISNPQEMQDFFKIRDGNPATNYFRNDI